MEEGFMTTNYTGLFAQKLSDGSVISVQVEEPNGNSLTLDPADYVSRGIQPPIDQLPDQFEHQGND
jgi:hypothetical protein